MENKNYVTVGEISIIAVVILVLSLCLSTLVSDLFTSPKNNDWKIQKCKNIAFAKKNLPEHLGNIYFFNSDYEVKDFKDVQSHIKSFTRDLETTNADVNTLRSFMSCLYDN